MELRNYTEVNLFKGNPIIEYLENVLSKVEQEINSTPKSIIENDEDFAGSLLDKYLLSTLMIYKDDRKVEQLSDQSISIKDDFGEYYDQPIKRFLVSYRFSGSQELFSLQPSVISLNHYNDNFVLSRIDSRIGCVFNIKSHIKLDATSFEGQINQTFKRLFDNIPYVTKNVAQFDSRLNSTINELISKRLHALNESEDFLNRLNNPKK